MRAAVTIDFHDTIAHCDRWFEAEVRTLAADVLGLHLRTHGAQLSAEEREAAVLTYRRIRLAVIECGIERDAVDCASATLAALGYALHHDDVSRLVESVMRETLSDLTPVAGAIELVRTLHVSGVPLGVVSSAVYHPFLEWTLQRFGIADAFETVVSSAGCGFYKSRPEIYQTAMRLLAAKPERSIHIGDSYEYDVIGARRIGMRTIWLNPSGVEAPGAAPDHEVSTLVGLAPLVQRRCLEEAASAV